jgi:hypothetical protein
MTPAAAVPQGQPTPDASAVAVTPRASRLLYAAVLGGLVLVYAPTVLWLF